MAITLLYVAYYLIALLYIGSGVLFFVKPKFVESHIHWLFPLLHHFKLTRIKNGVNLIVVGLILVLVGRGLSHGSLWGLFWALVLSAWEVYLSFAFYWKHLGEKGNAVLHFVLNVFLVILLGFVIIAHHSSEIESSKLHFFSLVDSSKPSIANVFTSLTVFSSKNK